VLVGRSDFERCWQAATEAEREACDAEIARLRAENERLRKQLREAKASIITKIECVERLEELLREWALQCKCQHEHVRMLLPKTHTALEEKE
jgi:hypothetical protein